MLPVGTKRTTGFSILVLGLILPLFGLNLSEAAPVEIARFVDQAIPIIGLIVALYGEYRAKSVLWFAKKK